MDLDKLNKWLSLGANVGVLAGIVFLAVELQQNTEILQAQARRDQLDARTASGELVITNSDLAEVAFKASNGEELTPLEEYRFDSWAYQKFRNWEWQFGEYLHGTLLVDELPVVGWANNFETYPRLREIWEMRKANLSPDFVEFVDTKVVSP